MRYLPKALSLLILLAFFSCASQENEMGDFVPLPIPSQLEISGVSNLSESLVSTDFEQARLHFIDENPLQTFESSSLNFEIVDGLTEKEQGYELVISADQILIRSSAEIGLWNGLMTLGQFLEDAGDQNVNLPQVEIKDEPALDYRAIHWDVKHHLEEKDYYFKLIDRLAKLKINGIIVEIEDKLAYELQPKVGSSDAFSIAEWKEISDYAMARNIRISPLVQGLGHASFILKHPEYFELRDDPSSDWAFNPLDEKTYEVQFDLYADALKAFPHAEYLHVGGDEVNTTGRESGKSALELQLIWLNRVSEYAEDKGVTPIFWDDMPLKNAKLYSTIYNRSLSSAEVDSIWNENEANLNSYLEMFPKNCIYMRWNYDTPENPGNTKAMEWFVKNDLQVMGATAGQTRWNLMPQQQSNAKNIRDFAKSSIAQSTQGLLLTLWDDDSPHFELYQRGIANFAEYTWSGEKRSIAEVQEAFLHRHFGYEVADAELAFIDLLEGPVADWKNLLLDGSDRNRIRNLSDPMNRAVIAFPNLDSAGVWSERYAEKILLAEANQEKVAEVLQKIESAKKLANRNQYTLEVYEQVAKAIQFSNRAILTLAQLDEPSGEEMAMAKQKLSSLTQEWEAIQSELEQVYGKTRSLNKPNDYILDQDHHVHLANQAKGFSDWQFYVEGLFVQKVKAEME